MFSACRSFLFVPADKPERMIKAASLPTDMVIIELEDGVSPENKPKARTEAGRVLSGNDFDHQPVAVRLNRIGTLSGAADILAVADWVRKPDLLVLPKVESAAEIRMYEALTAEMGVDCEFMAQIESSRGILNAGDIVVASPRLTSLSFGSADLSAEIGCQPTWDVLAPYRATLVTACGLTGAAAIDTPFLDLKDLGGLEAECRRTREMGFVGKLCIHPSQLEVVNAAFTPTPAEIERAERILKAAAEQGSGAITVDGRMVDKPVVKAAERLVAMAGKKRDT